MAYDSKVSEEQIEFFEKNMTLGDAMVIAKLGWITKDEHALYLAAHNVIREQKDKIESELMEKYYSDPKNDRRKESRRKNG